MDCFKSAKESNITYFMAGETRLKKYYKWNSQSLSSSRNTQAFGETGSTNWSNIWVNHLLKELAKHLANQASLAQWLSVPSQTNLILKWQQKCLKDEDNVVFVINATTLKKMAM